MDGWMDGWTGKLEKKTKRSSSDYRKLESVPNPFFLKSKVILYKCLLL
jgi:hypothetical protein